MTHGQKGILTRAFCLGLQSVVGTLIENAGES
jgi:hypothetical protein